MLGKIIILQLGRIGRRMYENHKILFRYEDAVVDLIASRCIEVDSGGRMIDSILSNSVLPEISSEILRRMMDGIFLTKVF